MIYYHALARSWKLKKEEVVSKNVFISAAMLVAAACAGETPSIQPLPVSSVDWLFISSTIQQVTEASECEGGWSLLVEEREAQGKGYEPAIQPAYVTRFATLADFTTAAVGAFSLVGEHFKTIRISLVWPCWMQSDKDKRMKWLGDMASAIEQLQGAGYIVEIMLSHHDAYPARFHGSSVSTSGWANDDIVDGFLEYVKSVMDSLEDVLPPGSRVYLINEPVGMLFNSYLGYGTWPPGGKNAGSSFAKAMKNMRDALYAAYWEIKDRDWLDWDVAIAKNIRPVVYGNNEDADRQLDYIFNWWLLDALLRGCVDDGFEGYCEDPREPASFDVVGVTFYGTMKTGNEVVSLGQEGMSAQLHKPDMDFQVNAAMFESALLLTIYRYEYHIGVVVGEIGFSSGTVDKMEGWMRSYLKAVLRLAAKYIQMLPVIGMHTLFESAEFSPGEWFFHAVGAIGMECTSDGKCGLTPWGDVLMKIASGG